MSGSHFAEGVRLLTLSQLPRWENPSVDSCPEAILTAVREKVAKDAVALTKPTAMEVKVLVTQVTDSLQPHGP